MARYDRIIRLRGSEVFEPACKGSIGYELDPEYNHGIALVVRGYLVAEDYSLDEFAAMVQTEAQKKAETAHFKAVFLIDSRNLTTPPAEPQPEKPEAEEPQTDTTPTPTKPETT